MKKLITILIIAIMSAAFSVTAFADDPEVELASACVHTDAEDTTLNKIDAVNATCTTPGTKEYWECSECGKFFSDQEGTEITDLEAWKAEGGEGYIAVSHALTHVDGIEATCLASGIKEYWECSECGKYFSDEAGTAEITDLEAWKAEGGEGYLAPAGHSYKSSITKQPTCTAEGEKTYTCEHCGDSYTETVDKIAHNISGGKCTKCGGKEDVVLKEDGNWYYVVGDDIQTSHTGIKPNKNGWWRIVNGMVDFDCTSVEKNENGWWYIKDGKVQFNYTGIKPNAHGWWRIVNGKVDFSCNTVEENENGWWYCKGGEVQFDYTGIRNNKNGWWRIVNGKVDFNCNTVEENEYGWWYCKGGRVQFGYTGIQQNRYGWWRIVNGKVDFGCNTIEENENGWWYCQGGKVNFDYTGFGYNKNGWWYVENGKVTFKKNGTIYGSINGVVDNWKVVNSKVSVNERLMEIKAQSYSSSTNWLILVDCSSNNLAVFYGKKGSWSLQAIWRTTTGAGSTKTPKGVFQIQYKTYSFSGPDTINPLVYSNPLCYTVYYASNFASGGYFIHSTLYRYQSWVDMDPSLGGHVSHGCIRLATKNAQWIYNNIPYGTTVVTY
ncbi:MAG: L,D-transpeptidase [Lachnospiraceae bacterium]|nr:L,D-transpeptidase [Lachnospiraceae bacterium]